MAITNRRLRYFGSVLCALLLPCVWSYCSQRTAASKGKPVQLKDVTYESLLAYAPADRMIVAAKCDAVNVASRGTRSQRIILDTHIVAGPDKGSSAQFSNFWQQKPVYTPGKVYLVAAYKGEFRLAWNLVEALEIDPDNAESAVQNATAELQRRSANEK